MDLLGLLALGFLLGMRHATDADHVVAVTAIAARHRRFLPAVLVGVLWGLGHSLMLCVVGGAILYFNWTVPPRVGLAFEFAVGLALVTVGALNVAAGGGARRDETAAPTSSWRAFVVGVVHGLGGSAAIALLVLASVRDPRAGILYLAVFSAGTVAGMVLVTAGIAAPARLLTAKWPGLFRPLRLATGFASLALGAFILYQTGLVDGLFGATPRFDPH
jgi:high-affinity nickel-transport protein